MGEAHAGAGEGTARILLEYTDKLRRSGGAFEADGVRVADVKDLAAYIINKVTGAYGGEKGRIPGYGHRYYGLYGRDPRAVDAAEHRQRVGPGRRVLHLGQRDRIDSEEEEGPRACASTSTA